MVQWFPAVPLYCGCVRMTPQVVLIFGWFIATICLFYEWSYFNEVLIRFRFLRWRVYLSFLKNEDILMKYWSVLLWRVYLSFFYEWKYFNEVLIRFTVTNFQIGVLLLSITLYLQVNYVKPKCSQKETFPCYLFNTPFRKNQKPYNSCR